MAARAFGAGCLLARRLVEAGVTFVEVNVDGWDTHEDNFNRTTDRNGQIDQPMAQLITDLERARDARADAGDLDGRVRPHAANQRPGGPRPLSPRVQRGAGRRRHPRRAGHRRKPMPAASK